MAKGDEGDEFNWNDTDSLVTRGVRSTAIYTNPHGEAVIRQHGDYGEDDPFVFFPVDYIPVVIKRLTEIYDQRDDK